MYTRVYDTYSSSMVYPGEETRTVRNLQPQRLMKTTAFVKWKNMQRQIMFPCSFVDVRVVEVFSFKTSLLDSHQHFLTPIANMEISKIGRFEVLKDWARWRVTSCDLAGSWDLYLVRFWPANLEGNLPNWGVNRGVNKQPAGNRDHESIIWTNYDSLSQILDLFSLELR